MFGGFDGGCGGRGGEWIWIVIIIIVILCLVGDGGFLGLGGRDDCCC